MGTNYYWMKDACEKCGHGEEIHIGKSSCGWAFSLRVYPEMGINTLDDWKSRLSTGLIRNEYNELKSLDDLLGIIADRHDPHGLLRHDEAVDPYFRGRSWPGEGTWDYCNYEFS